MSQTAQVAIIDDPHFDAHEERGGHHPERPERLIAARAGLYAAVPESRREPLPARRATDAEIGTTHSAGYLRTLHATLSRGDFGNLDADTFYSPGSDDATFLAAGGAVDLARHLISAHQTRGVALLRPPGHHAEPDHAMGFCMLNNIALAAHAALASGARRVAIVDWDVHHGNGTQHAFYDDPRVLFISLHQYPWYPGTGAAGETGRGAGLGYTANLPLPAGQGPETYGHAFRHVVLPLLERFGADLVLVSAGFDAHTRDPLAQMNLDADSYRAMASALIAQADAAGHGRVGFLLEGGYDLQGLEQSVRGVGRALMGDRLELPESRPDTAGLEAVALSAHALGLPTPG
ncbi:MAG: histone deacetylase [Myxococcales bacterium]|jgi:acetoin utilization deacetylase AcuC-like enzyme